jgi:hypothetical protein
VRYVVTGPTAIGDQGRVIVVNMMKGLKDVEEVTTGAAHGVDTIAAIAGMKYHPKARHRVIIPGAPCNFAWATSLSGVLNVEVTEMPVSDGTHAEMYRARNEAMFEPLDVERQTLIAFVHNFKFYRSGEHMTINIARKLGVSLVLSHVPREVKR